MKILQDDIHRALPDLTAVILAGGQSSRFGEPKAFARVNNQTLLDMALTLGSEISSQRMLILKEKPSADIPGVECYADVIKDCGPLAGIYTALLHCNTTWAAILPCDMPMLSAVVYHHLYSFRSTNRPVVAVSGFGLEPLVSIWPKKNCGMIGDMLMDGEYTLQTCMRELAAVHVKIPEATSRLKPSIFSNVNFKDDLVKINRTFKKELGS